jgi:hypothetical protein
LARTSLPDQETLLSAVHQILTNIPIEMLGRVVDDWIQRLDECVARAGEYVSEIKKKFQKYSIFAKMVRTARTSGPPYIC